MKFFWFEDFCHARGHRSSFRLAMPSGVEEACLFVQALLVVYDLLNALVSPAERAADGEGDEAEAEAEEVAAVAG